MLSTLISYLILLFICNSLRHLVGNPQRGELSDNRLVLTIWLTSALKCLPLFLLLVLTQVAPPVSAEHDQLVALMSAGLAAAIFGDFLFRCFFYMPSVFSGRVWLLVAGVLYQIFGYSPMMMVIYIVLAGHGLKCYWPFTWSWLCNGDSVAILLYTLAFGFEPLLLDMAKIWDTLKMCGLVSLQLMLYFYCYCAQTRPIWYPPIKRPEAISAQFVTLAIMAWRAYAYYLSHFNAAESSRFGYVGVATFAFSEFMRIQKEPLAMESLGITLTYYLAHCLTVLPALYP